MHTGEGNEKAGQREGERVADSYERREGREREREKGQRGHNQLESENIEAREGKRKRRQHATVSPC